MTDIFCIDPKGYKGIIFQYLKSLREQDPNDGWVMEGKLHAIQTSFGWIGFRGDRDARRMVEKGILEGGKRGMEYQWVRSKEGTAIESRSEKKLREQDERTNALLEAARRGQAICQ